MKKRDSYHQSLDECMTAKQLEYLTVPCSTRPKATAKKAQRLINEGKYAAALKLADPIAYEVGFNEFR